MIFARERCASSRVDVSVVLVIIEDEPEVARVSIEKLSMARAVGRVEQPGSAVREAGSGSFAPEPERAGF